MDFAPTKSSCYKLLISLQSSATLLWRKLFPNSARSIGGPGAATRLQGRRPSELRYHRAQATSLLAPDFTACGT
jgi:hypothetical protein